MDGGGEVAGGVEGAFEAEAVERRVMQVGGALHEDADEIVSNKPDQDFLFDHVGGLASKHVHGEGHFDLVEV